MVDNIFLIFGHYILIQLSIVAFFVPFYLVYRYKHYKSGSKSLPFNEHLEYFFSSRQANYLVFTWAALEALVWFVIPEFLLVLVIFLRIRNKVQLLIYDVIGTVVGTTVAFLVPVVSNHSLNTIPYVQPNMVSQVEVWYQHLGLLGLLFQPFSGVPFKVFTLTANRFDFFFPAFVVFAVLVRISRYYIFYLLFSGIYPFVHRLIYKNYLPLFLVACFIFTLALLKVYNLYGPDYAIDYTFIERFKFLKDLVPFFN